MRVLGSLLLELWLALSMIVMGALALPFALCDRKYAWTWSRTWFSLGLRAFRILCGGRVEIRGTVPTEPVLIAAKHQSFLDVLALVDALPNGRFVMKSELRRLPIFGWYAARCGMVFVERGRGAEAVRKMTEALASLDQADRQIVIFPQGTRVAPGVEAPYKIGVQRIYEAFGRPCVPVALATGHLWGRKSALKRSGVAVIEFLPEIAPGLDSETFMSELEERVEAASNRLAEEVSARR